MTIRLYIFPPLLLCKLSKQPMSRGFKFHPAVWVGFKFEYCLEIEGKGEGGGRGYSERKVLYLIDDTKLFHFRDSKI